MSASTWSDAAAYSEGTGKDILSINKPYSQTTLVLNSPLTTNCYFLTLKDNTTSSSTTYYIFEDDYQSLNNWIELQTNKEVTQLILQQKNYVSI